MKSNKQRKKEIKESRQAKEAKRQVAKLQNKLFGKEFQRIPVSPNALSEKSKRSWSTLKYYEDQIYRCVECGKETVFSAEQQREWYEIKKRDIYLKPVRCHQHFVEWAIARQVKLKMAKALEDLRLHPNSGEIKRNCALSIVEFHKNTGKGNLNTALHLLRKLNGSADEDAITYCNEQIQKASQAKEKMQKYIEALTLETILSLKCSVDNSKEIETAFLYFLGSGCHAGIEIRELFRPLCTAVDSFVEQVELSEVNKAAIWELMMKVVAEIYEYLGNGKSLSDAIGLYRKRMEK